VFFLISCEIDSINGSKVNRKDMKQLQGTWVSTSIEPNGDLAKASEFLPQKLSITFKDCHTKSNSICSGIFTIDEEEPFEYDFTIGIYAASERTAILFNDTQVQSHFSPDSKSYHFIDNNILSLLRSEKNRLFFEFGGPNFGSYILKMEKE
jgi:hypothetical protein